MPSGYVRIKAPDDVKDQIVIQVGAFSGSNWTISDASGTVSAFRVNKIAEIDTVMFVSNRSDKEVEVAVKVQNSDGTNAADTTVDVPAFGEVEIPLSQFF